MPPTTETVDPANPFGLYKRARAEGRTQDEAAHDVASRFGHERHPANVRRFRDELVAKEEQEAREADNPPPVPLADAGEDEFEAIRTDAAARARALRDDIARMAPEALVDTDVARAQANAEAELARVERALRNVTLARDEVRRRRRDEGAEEERRREDAQAQQALQATIERASRRVPA